MTMVTMDDRDGVIWMDGSFVPWREAKIHVLTHTLHYGMGVFEGVRAYHAEKGTAIFRLQEHTDRLFRSAHIMQMTMPYSKDEINDAQLEAVSKNELSSAYIRPMVFYGSEHQKEPTNLKKKNACENIKIFRFSQATRVRKLESKRIKAMIAWWKAIP